MLDELRQRIGYRAALRAASRRPAPETPARPHEGRVLILLPTEEDDLRAAWRFVRLFDVPKAQLMPVLAAERVPYTPDAFVAGVTTVGEKARDWRGLPRRAVAEGIWKGPLHLALDLTAGFDLAAAYLVGASPARFRVGLYSDVGEPFYDLLVAPADGYEAGLDALHRYLLAIEPPVLRFTD